MDRYICSICNQQFRHEETLLAHEAIHSEPVKYTCWICGKGFDNSHSLKQHVLNHTDTHPFSCKKCKKRFKTFSDIQYHLRAHARKRFLCDECGKALRTVESLRQHKLMHEGRKKPFACSECDKSFHFKNGLQVHMRIHTGEKPYLCTECGTSFTHKSSFTRHIQFNLCEKVLSTVKPFICGDCGKGFGGRRLLKQHMNRHNGYVPPSQLRRRQKVKQLRKLRKLEEMMNSKTEQDEIFEVNISSGCPLVICDSDRQMMEGSIESLKTVVSSVIDQKADVDSLQYKSPDDVLQNLTSVGKTKRVFVKLEKFGEANEQSEYELHDEVINPNEVVLLECSNEELQKTLSEWSDKREEFLEYDSNEQDPNISMKEEIPVTIHDGASVNQLSTKELSVKYIGHVKDYDGVKLQMAVSCKDSEIFLSKPFSCNICHKRFSKKWHLRYHLTTHTDEKPYACNMCDKSFKWRKSMDDHMRAHFNSPEYGQPDEMGRSTDAYGSCRYVCNNCKKGFSTSFQLKRHMMTHTGVKPFQCENCNKSFTTKEYLNAHAAMHLEDDVPIKSDGLACGKCNKIFRRLYSLRRHMMIHFRNRQCFECDETFDDSEALKLHMTSHVVPQEQCDVSDELTTSIGTTDAVSILYGQPVQIVSSVEVPFHCEECGNRFQNKLELDRHAEEHKNVCLECGRRFFSQLMLRRHKEDRCFHVCRVCGLEFCSTIILKSHMHKSHNKEFRDYIMLLGRDGMNKLQDVQNTVEYSLDDNYMVVDTDLGDSGAMSVATVEEIVDSVDDDVDDCTRLLITND